MLLPQADFDGVICLPFSLKVYFWGEEWILDGPQVNR